MTPPADPLADPPADDPLALRRKRLLYRSHYRGTQEADLLIGTFAERHLPAMTAAHLDEFEQLLEENDVDLVNWITGRTAAPDDLQGPVWQLLKTFKLPVVKN